MNSADEGERTPLPPLTPAEERQKMARLESAVGQQADGAHSVQDSAGGQQADGAHSVQDSAGGQRANGTHSVLDNAPLPSALMPIRLPTRIAAAASTPGQLWLSGDNALYRYRMASRSLEAAPLSLRGTNATVVGAEADGKVLYLDLAERGITQALLRYDTQSGVVSTLGARGPLGPWRLALQRLWISQHSTRSTVIRVVGMGSGGWLEGEVENEALPSSASFEVDFARSLPVASSLPTCLALQPESLLMGTEDGALLRLDLKSNRWSVVLSGGAEGGGAILGIEPYQDGFAVSSKWHGLLRVPASGPVSVIDPDAHFEMLTADGPDLWGIEEGHLARYNGRLKRRVHYVAPESLELAVALLALPQGIWVSTRNGVYQLDPRSGFLKMAVNAVNQAVPESRPPDEEIDQIVHVISKLTPPARRRAYEKILSEGAAGYDEVFLVGLNEDDPLTLELVTEYFRFNHPDRAIEPLLDVLIFIQGDRALREHVAGIIQSFGPSAVPAVATRLVEEAPERLAGGARKALEQILVAIVDQGGPEVLNRFLKHAQPEWLMVYGKAEAPTDYLPRFDAATFRILGRHLREGSDYRVLEGSLRILSRLARSPELPESVEELVPVLLRHLHGRNRRWALYALALVGDARATASCIDIARRDARLRFWAIQSLAATSDPRAYPIIIEALDDKRPEVRAAAAFLTRSELILDSAPALRQQLADESGELCLSCVDALASFRDPEAGPVLEARLPRARREAQAGILQAIFTVGGADVARRIQGWVEIEILAPARLGRIHPESGASRDVLSAAMALIAVDGGPEGRRFVARVAEDFPDAGAEAAREALLLAEALPAGLGRILERAVLGNHLPAVWSGVPFALPDRGSPKSESLEGIPPQALEALLQIDQDTFSLLRPMLYLLAPRMADASARGALEDILLHAVSPPDRQEAARALFALADPASKPALAKALHDPYFESGPFPFFRYPVRHLAARALSRLGVKVSKHADRSFSLEVG